MARPEVEYDALFAAHPEMREIFHELFEPYMRPLPTEPKRSVTMREFVIQRIRVLESRQVALERAKRKLDALEHLNYVALVDHSAHPKWDHEIQADIIHSTAHSVALQTASSALSVKAAVQTACAAVNDFPVLQKHLQEARISRAHAEEIIRMSGELDEEQIEEYLDVALRMARRYSPYRLRHRLKNTETGSYCPTPKARAGTTTCHSEKSR